MKRLKIYGQDEDGEYNPEPMVSVEIEEIRFSELFKFLDEEIRHQAWEMECAAKRASGKQQDVVHFGGIVGVDHKKEDSGV